MSKDPVEEQPNSVEPYTGGSRSTVLIVVSISAVLAVVALLGTAV